MLLGIFVGATPGLTATMAVALIVPITFYMPPTTGLAMIIGVSFTAIFAGDIPATYLRIPGTPASAAATLDGYAMSRQGKGNFALTMDVLCSSLGGLVGVLSLMFLAPQLAEFALKFSDYEYFWLALFGLSMSAVVSQGTLIYGVLIAVFGMGLSTVGLDMVTGEQRYTMGSLQLMDGLTLIPVMIGLFGMSEVIRFFRDQSGTDQPTREHAQKLPTRLPVVTSLHELKKNKGTLLQSSFLGTLIGALPGAGADIAAWAAYGLSKRRSRNGAAFGTGIAEGVIAPTSANNAAVAGAWIPALVFGIPGDAVTAIVLGALMMYEIRPGPSLFTEGGEQMQQLFGIALATQVLLIPCGLLGIRLFSHVASLNRRILMTAVVAFSIVGAYTIRESLFDIYLMFLFGLLGAFLDRRKVPLAPLILGFILGPVVEENLRTGLIKSQGDWIPFVTRPISFGLMVLLVLTLTGPWWGRFFRQNPSH